MAVDFLTLAYAVTVAAGGVVGYVKAGSTASLVAGLVSGALMGIGTYQMSIEPKNVTVALLTSGVLLIVMGYRFANSGKVMPAGLVTALSLLMVIRLGIRLNQ